MTFESIGRIHTIVVILSVTPGLEVSVAQSNVLFCNSEHPKSLNTEYSPQIFTIQYDTENSNSNLENAAPLQLSLFTNHAVPNSTNTGTLVSTCVEMDMDTSDRSDSGEKYSTSSSRFRRRISKEQTTSNVEG